METIEATFRVVTPMFLSGADQDKAELRLPSIKGALRFWWRALAWNWYDGNLDRIRGEEAKLFGSTDTGQAAVLMRLELSHHVGKFIQNQSASNWNINDWQSYVGYGLVDKKEKPKREYFNPGLEFRLQLSAKQAESLSNIRDTLIAFGLLGGLGGRSRKGWGSVNLTQIRADHNQLAWEPPQEFDELKQQVRSLIKANDESLPEYTAFSSQTHVEFCPLQRNAADAHRYLAQLYKETIRSVPGKAQREQFGLPRPRIGTERRASPLFLHVQELPDGQGVPMAVFLPAKFLEDREVPDGGWQQVQRFLNGVASGEVQ